MFAQDTCLKQLDGNQTALQQIINRFLELHQGDDKRLEEYIEKEDYRKAEELIHQLKGISGNLGCIELYKCCKSFQKELRKRNPDRIEEFKALWEKTLKEQEPARAAGMEGGEDAELERILREESEKLFGLKTEKTGQTEHSGKAAGS